MAADWGRIPGRIYLCLPDEAKSFVAGTFDAEIKPAAANLNQRHTAQVTEVAVRNTLWTP